MKSKVEQFETAFARAHILQNRLSRLAKYVCPEDNPGRVLKQVRLSLATAIELAMSKANLMLISTQRMPDDFAEGGSVTNANNVGGELILPNQSPSQSPPSSP